MPDIAMCGQTLCPIKESCYRFNAVPDYMQTFIRPEMGEHVTEKGCDRYWKMETSMKFLSFAKDEESRWYMMLPEWEGEHADLEMVAGADTMLDIIAQGETEVRLTISEDRFDEWTYELSFLRNSLGGAAYKLTTASMYSDLMFEVWLCHVIKFVYGKIPKTLYIK